MKSWHRLTGWRLCGATCWHSCQAVWWWCHRREACSGGSVFWGVGWWRWWCGEGRGGDGTGNYWLVASSIITVEPSAVKYTTWPREPQADQGRRNSSTQPHTHAKANTGRLLLSWLCDIRLIICIASKIRVTEKKAKNRQGKKNENNRILELVCESWEENVCLEINEKMWVELIIICNS